MTKYFKFKIRALQWWKANRRDLIVSIWGFCGFCILEKWEPEIYEWHERRREWQRKMIKEHLLMISFILWWSALLHLAHIDSCAFTTLLERKILAAIHVE
jgi:hypothetical protein